MSADASAQPIPQQRWVRIIPATIVLYVISFMDRMNISFAIAGGMNQSLGLTMTVAGLAAGIFFIGYMFLQIPGGHMAEHRSAKKFILWTIIGWGGLSILNGFVQNEWQLLAVRFLLGIAEGGVYPAILVILSNWFPAKEIGRANAMFMTSTSIAAIITNPVSGWIVANFDWRWLFIIEGVVSLALIFIWMPLISDRPEEAKWLSKAEKEYLVETLRAEKEAAKKTAQEVSAALSYKQLLMNKYLWLMILIFNCGMVGAYGFGIWLPTILKNLTKMGMTQVGFLSVLPFVVSIFGLYIIAYFSDKSRNRRFYTGLPMACFGIGLWLSTLFPDNMWFSYGLLVVTGLFIKSMPSSFWTMIPLLFPAGIAGGTRGIINAFGNLGSFLGPYMVGWIATAYDMKIGMYSLVFSLLLGAALTMLLPAVTGGKAQIKGESAITGKT
ncbi:MAG: MFS transporter [Negativicutes bacterium]|nr:MFS transporter [Negativicutes bacterium]